MRTFVPGMLDDEYESLRRTVAEFTDEEVAPVSAELDAKHEFPYELVAKMGDSVDIRRMHQRQNEDKKAWRICRECIDRHGQIGRAHV